MKGDIYTEYVKMLNETLRISKYVTNYKGDYKKDKKVVKKMLKNVENGNGQKYLANSCEDELYE